MIDELVFFPGWAAGRRGYAERIRDLFYRHVQDKGLMHTHQRDDILNVLLQANRHLSQDEIYAAVREKGIGKVTVFRTLKLLEEAALIERVHDSEGRPRYEVKMDRPHHDHLVCISCGGIQEIQWPEIERFQEKACRAKNFQALYHRHEVFGRCQACVAKELPQSELNILPRGH